MIDGRIQISANWRIGILPVVGATMAKYGSIINVTLLIRFRGIFNVHVTIRDIYTWLQNLSLQTEFRQNCHMSTYILL